MAGTLCNQTTRYTGKLAKFYHCMPLTRSIGLPPGAGRQDHVNIKGQNVGFKHVEQVHSRHGPATSPQAPTNAHNPVPVAFNVGVNIPRFSPSGVGQVPIISLRVRQTDLSGFSRLSRQMLRIYGTSSNMEIVEPIFQLERFEASETLILFSAHLPFPCLAQHVQTQNLCPGLLTGCLLCVCIASPCNLRTLRQLEFVALLALTTLGWNVRGYQLITAPPDSNKTTMTQLRASNVDDPPENSHHPTLKAPRAVKCNTRRGADQ
ncbi:hypothetical protein X797_007343 [Metarhizium robertsii]|uniref:Uncharacterized protein n=1 Tax=Metarhizium robertsii TaxID=568076 RepID=A0A014NCZ5_9HYPO|nr:hypothetical protein X797_007343 [Metarhizium robertsii]